MIQSHTSITPEDVANHYDELDEFYREIWGTHVHHGFWTQDSLGANKEAATRRLSLEVAKRAGIGPSSRVIDVGCGYGATARLLSQEFGAAVTGITVSPQQFAFAKAESVKFPNVDFFCEDWHKNSQESSQFDSAIAIESTEHMIDKNLCMSEMFRVLKPGGRLVLCVWLTGATPSKWESRFLLEPICSEGRLPAMGNILDYCQLLKKAGFQNVSHEDITSNVARTWGLCIAGFLKRFATESKYRAYFKNTQAKNREFALTLLRIWAAYKVGAMKYGIFSAEKGLA